MDAFAALADTTRRQILELLGDRERSAGEVAQQFRISRPAVSRHLRVLRQAGLAQVRRDAQRRIYRIEPAPLAEVDAWIGRYRRFWGARGSTGSAAPGGRGSIETASNQIAERLDRGLPPDAGCTTGG